MELGQEMEPEPEPEPGPGLHGSGWGGPRWGCSGATNSPSGANELVFALQGAEPGSASAAAANPLWLLQTTMRNVLHPVSLEMQR